MINFLQIKAKSIKVVLFSALCFTFIFITACLEEAPTFEKNRIIPSHSWQSRDSQHYQVHITDNKKPYNISVNFRHSPAYQRSSISLLISEKNPENTEKKINAVITLATEDGRWKGIGTGNIFNNQVLILKDYHYPDTGLYHYSISHNMNQNPLAGVLSVGLKVEKVN